MQDSCEYVKTWMLCLVTSQLHFSFGQSILKAMEAGCDLKILVTVTVLISSLHLHLRASEIQNTANELLKISSVNGRKVIQDENKKSSVYSTPSCFLTVTIDSVFLMESCFP